jgi:catechol 2,3-dioxygenase-like lactoylglutathione lyase family enzyme
VPDAHLRVSRVALPGGADLELIEYVKPEGKRLGLRTCNAGVAHIAFVVEDADKLYKDLSGKGVDFVSPPVWAPAAGGGKGRWRVSYFHGPDGITFEMIQKTE